MFFAADDGTHGEELWKSDGSDGRHRHGQEHRAVRRVRVRPRQPSLVFDRDGSRLFFAADDGTHGDELWNSDGTAEGTVLVKDIRPGATP